MILEAIKEVIKKKRINVIKNTEIKVWAI